MGSHRGGPDLPGDAIEYAKTREQFGKPIASFQLTQAKLSWMAADLYRRSCSRCTSGG